MKPDEKFPGADRLRRLAEEQLLDPGRGSPTREDHPLRQLYELRVLQIELETQNEELLRARGESEAALARYRDLYDNAPVGYFTLDLAGCIREVNLAGARLLGMERPHLLGRPFRQFVAEGDRPDLGKFLARQLARRRPGRCELAIKDGGEAGKAVYVFIQGVTNPDGHSFSMVATDISAFREVETQFAEAGRSLKSMARRLGHAEEDLRKRLALELHDHIGANLGSLAILLKLARQRLKPGDGALASLDSAASLVKDTIKRVRFITSELRPTTMDYSGLGAALTEYAEEIRARTGVEVTLKLPGADLKLAEEVESTLFRVVQEALHNCAKHAQATSVAVEIRMVGGRPRLSISDDGVGFDPEELGQPGRAPGLGLLAMRERAESIGWAFHVEAEPGKGTCIILAEQE